MIVIVRKIFRHNSQFLNYIFTRSVLNHEKYNGQNFSNEKREPNNEKVKEKSSSILKEKTETLPNDVSASSKSSISNTGKVEKGQKLKKNYFNPFQKVAGSLIKNVAKELGENQKKTREELLDYLKTINILNDPVETEKDNVNLNYEQYFNREKNYFKSNVPFENIVFPLFNQNTKIEDNNEVKLKIWDDLEAEELALRSKRHPKNYFEELINWTNEGKLWHFPIDNDQGLDEEAKISFTEHIFMEYYLEPWCPEKGPLRKFMELVLIGLSKNPYFTVEEKKSHIEWFRNYFENKKKLLQELGAVGPPKKIEVPEQEQEKNS